MLSRLVLILSLVCLLGAASSLANPEADILENLAYDEVLEAISASTEPGARVRHWNRALELTEQAYEAAESPAERTLILGHLAERAFHAGQLIKASRYADRALREFRALEGQAFARVTVAGSYHNAHLVLGKLALRDGDVVVAIEHLHLAARTDGSPCLKSFGPNMALAQELLELGERDAVLEYFDLCRRFWRLGVERGTLDQWAAIVRQGGIPDFRGNLIYGL